MVTRAGAWKAELSLSGRGGKGSENKGTKTRVLGPGVGREEVGKLSWKRVEPGKDEATQ